jgi:phosphinothricin acetyltransferase
MAIRDATAADLPGILSIYNDAVQHTTAIWNETLVDLANRRAWLTERVAQGFPVLVARDAYEVLGYATFGAWRPHDGYRYSVEHSLYVRTDRHGQGLGAQLLTALIERARACDKHVMVAAIESGNAASIHLHQRLGFIGTGQMPQVGCKFGRWLDLTLMQLTLNPGAEPPIA